MLPFPQVCKELGRGAVGMLEMISPPPIAELVNIMAEVPDLASKMELQTIELAVFCLFLCDSTS